jgi:hypothetical protein
MARHAVAGKEPAVPGPCGAGAHGERLRLAIQQRGMRKLSVVACSIGVTESAVSRWRSGGAMTLGNIANVCLALDISADWLVLGRGHMDMHLAGAAHGFPHITRSVAKLSPHARRQLHHFLTALVDA